MAYNVLPLTKLIEQFERLPGIGRKSAQRLAYYVLGLPKEQVETALRVSFSRFSTQEDVEALLEGLQAGLASLAHRA